MATMALRTPPLWVSWAGLLPIVAVAVLGCFDQDARPGGDPSATSRQALRSEEVRTKDGDPARCLPGRADCGDPCLFVRRMRQTVGPDLVISGVDYGDADNREMALTVVNCGQATAAPSKSMVCLGDDRCSTALVPELLPGQTTRLALTAPEARKTRTETMPAHRLVAKVNAHGTVTDEYRDNNRFDTALDVPSLDPADDNACRLTRCERLVEDCVRDDAPHCSDGRFMNGELFAPGAPVAALQYPDNSKELFVLNRVMVRRDADPSALAAFLARYRGQVVFEDRMAGTSVKLVSIAPVPRAGTRLEAFQTALGKAFRFSSQEAITFIEVLLEAQASPEFASLGLQPERIYLPSLAPLKAEDHPSLDSAFLAEALPTPVCAALGYAGDQPPPATAPTCQEQPAPPQGDAAYDAYMSNWRRPVPARWLPWAWTHLEYAAAKPQTERTKVAIIDDGFALNTVDGTGYVGQDACAADCQDGSNDNCDSCHDMLLDGACNPGTATFSYLWRDLPGGTCQPPIQNNARMILTDESPANMAGGPRTHSCRLNTVREFLDSESALLDQVVGQWSASCSIKTSPALGALFALPIINTFLLAIFEIWWNADGKEMAVDEVMQHLAGANLLGGLLGIFEDEVVMANAVAECEALLDAAIVEIADSYGESFAWTCSAILNEALDTCLTGLGVSHDHLIGMMQRTATCKTLDLLSESIIACPESCADGDCYAEMLENLQDDTSNWCAENLFPGDTMGLCEQFVQDTIGLCDPNSAEEQNACNKGLHTEPLCCLLRSLETTCHVAAGQCNTCGSHEDCSPVEMCIFGQCTLSVPVCEDNSDCPSQELCVERECRRCDGPADCGQAFTCAPALVACASCEGPEDCAAPLVCVNGLCGIGDACPEGETCPDPYCTDNFCQIDPEPCTGADNCPDGCRHSTCVTPPTLDAPLWHHYGRLLDHLGAVVPTIEHCQWHGTLVANAAFGTLDSGWGGAGSAGPQRPGGQNDRYIEPILIRTDFTAGSVALAVQQAIDQDADIINLSFAAPCGPVCQALLSGDIASTSDTFGQGGIVTGEFNVDFDAEAGLDGEVVQTAYDQGRIVIAAAGHGGANLASPDFDVVPCTWENVICVGGVVETGESTWGLHVMSNYGHRSGNRGVDIFAPWSLPVSSPLPSGSDARPTTFLGTSASAAYVSGIAAMMHRIDPEIQPHEVGSALRNEAAVHLAARVVYLQTPLPPDGTWPQQAFDGDVPAALAWPIGDSSLAVRIVNPRDSVRAAGPVLPDYLEDDTPLSDTAVESIAIPTDKGYENLTIHPGDVDYFTVPSAYPTCRAYRLELRSLKGEVTFDRLYYTEVDEQLQQVWKDKSVEEDVVESAYVPYTVASTLEDLVRTHTLDLRNPSFISHWAVRVVGSFETSQDGYDLSARWIYPTDPALDVQNADWDEDGLKNAVDGCPCIYDPDGADTDGDGIGDACDDDIDDDGIGNAQDNCDFVPNPDQDNYDCDPYGDACDNCDCLAHAQNNGGDWAGPICDTCHDLPAPTCTPAQPPLPGFPTCSSASCLLHYCAEGSCEFHFMPDVKMHILHIPPDATTAEQPARLELVMDNVPPDWRVLIQNGEDGALEPYPMPGGEDPTLPGERLFQFVLEGGGRPGFAVVVTGSAESAAAMADRGEMMKTRFVLNDPNATP